MNEQAIEEMRAELARINQDIIDHPSIDEDDWDLFPMAAEKFGSFAAYDAHYKARNARRRELLRTIGNRNG